MPLHPVKGWTPHGFAEVPASTTVTLEARSDQARALFAAQAKGKLQLVMRGLGSETLVSAAPITETAA